MRTRTQRALRLIAAFMLLGASIACGSDGGSSTDDDTEEETESTGEIRITEVVFARAIDEQWNPVGGTVTEFRADETTVVARATIDGRPSEGVIRMRWMWRDLEVAHADVDLGSVNEGLLFSFGQNTYLRSTLTTRHLYIGEGHRLVLMHGERELGSYPFRVVPPQGARPSSFVSGGLYRTEDTSAPATTFGPQDPVFIHGEVALGNKSWFDALVYVNGQKDNTLTQEIIGPADGGDVRAFHFRLAPANGWPPVTHRVELVLDDREVARYELTIGAAAPPG
jgi:hypothetical protein